MHGRIKVKTTAEQQAAKLKEQEKKLQLFTAAWKRLTEKRKNSDYDKEVLELSGQILCKIPDVHTLWNIRRETFQFLQSALDEEEYGSRCRDELAFTEFCLQVNPKSYGCWEHRCWILDNSPKPDWERELLLCNRYLDLDERNFHCWDYRRFVVNRSKTEAKNEFKYTTDKISANFSNFSSWHYRSKLLPILYPDSENPVGIKQEILLSELNMVQSAFFTDPNDQSAWFYHRWLLGKSEVPVKCDLAYLTQGRQTLIVRFTKSIKQFQSSIRVDGEQVEVKFTPVSLNSMSSYIWSCNLTQTIQVDSVLEIDVLDDKFTLKVLGTDDIWYQNDEIVNLATIEFGKAAKEVLLNELDMLTQLHDLEPDNKWAMLTIISLLRKLSEDGALNEVEKYLDRLKTVDPYRVNYYNDIRSKYIVEYVLMSRSNESRTIDLSSRRLTCLYYPEHFVLVTDLNLSNNDLIDLKGFHLLLSLRKLNLSKNKISSLEHLGVLPLLEELLLGENFISDKSSLEIVRKQPKLIRFEIVDNPVFDLIDADELCELMKNKCG